MTQEIKQTTGLSLRWAWGIRLRFWAEGNKLRAEGNKLLAEGDKLRAEGDKLWAEAVIEVHGNIAISWSYADTGGEICRLETGEVFEP